MLTAITGQLENLTEHRGEMRRRGVRIDREFCWLRLQEHTTGTSSLLESRMRPHEHQMIVGCRKCKRGTSPTRVPRNKLEWAGEFGDTTQKAVSRLSLLSLSHTIRALCSAHQLAERVPNKRVERANSLNLAVRRRRRCYYFNQLLIRRRRRY